MLNYDEARGIINYKMRRFLSWSIYAVSEDEDNYYFFYGADGEPHPDPDMPVFAVDKAKGKVKKLSIFNKDNFKALYAARVFYHREKRICYNVEERSAIRRKLTFPDSVVICPRCGEKLQWIKQGTCIYIQCSKKYCIYCSIRKW